MVSRFEKSLAKNAIYVQNPPDPACFQECEFAFEMIIPSSLYHGGGQLNAATSTTNCDELICALHSVQCTVDPVCAQIASQHRFLLKYCRVWYCKEMLVCWQHFLGIYSCEISLYIL